MMLRYKDLALHMKSLPTQRLQITGNFRIVTAESAKTISSGRRRVGTVKKKSG
jgi:hypothetical protein